MTALGFDILPGEHPIVPVMFGDAAEAGRLAEALVQRGVYVVAFSYPVVPMGKARIRTQMSAAHTIADLDNAAEQFRRRATSSADGQVGRGPPAAARDVVHGNEYDRNDRALRQRRGRTRDGGERAKRHNPGDGCGGRGRIDAGVGDEHEEQPERREKVEQAEHCDQRSRDGQPEASLGRESGEQTDDRDAEEQRARWRVGPASGRHQDEHREGHDERRGSEHRDGRDERAGTRRHAHPEAPGRNGSRVSGDQRGESGGRRRREGEEQPALPAREEGRREPWPPQRPQHDHGDEGDAQDAAQGVTVTLERRHRRERPRRADDADRRADGDERGERDELPGRLRRRDLPVTGWMLHGARMRAASPAAGRSRPAVAAGRSAARSSAIRFHRPVADLQPDPSPLDGRPFYHRFAWAYDLIIERTAGPQVEQVARILARHGLSAGSSLVDAGCGTGAYAVGLAGRGYAVTAMDRSPELLALAAERARRHGSTVELACGDLTRAWTPPEPVDGVLCRGVLNDLVEDADRARAFAAFASWLRPSGILLLDVRDSDGSLQRYADRSVFERTVRRGEDVLTYASTTSVEPPSDRLQLVESWAGTVGGLAVEVENAFEMRCWTAGALERLAAAAGFARLSLLDPQIVGARGDRLVALAVR